MKILKDVALKQYTTFKIGGPAKFFCEPTNKDEIIFAFNYAKENNLSTFILGLGANVLFSDDGFDGLVIHQKNGGINVKDNMVIAESGVVVENLINIALENNLIGLEDFSGIPSTIGGALYINLHYFDSFIADIVRSASILDKNTLEVRSVDQDWFNFGYDSSKLKANKDYMLIDATIELKKVDDYGKYFALGKSKEIIRTRKYKYPSEPSVGSIFQNLTTEEQKQNDLPTRSVAYLIDVCGLKGTKVGDALLSHRHSNMIVNIGNAKARDVIELAEIIKEKVKERFGVDLRFEVQLVGF